MYLLSRKLLTLGVGLTSMLLASGAAAFCKEDVNVIVMYELSQDGKLVWQSEALKAHLLDDTLCLVKSKKEEPPVSAEVVRIGEDNFWVSLPGSFENEKPKKREDDAFKLSELTLEFSKFMAVADGAVCPSRQSFTISADPLSVGDAANAQCFASLDGVTIQVSVVRFNEEQQKAVKEKKSFWDLDSADEKAEKRMKKF